MHLNNLSLTSFRNFIRLELELPSRLVLLAGDNAQGKTNLLEAIYMLATSRSFRADNERELINWNCSGPELPVARIFSRVEKKDEKLEIEIALQLLNSGNVNQANNESRYIESETGSVQKRYKVNGIFRRATGLIGKVNVVMFGPQDIEIISGPPSLRRRYLDILCSQINSRYLRSLQYYQRVIFQRNKLLKMIQENRAALNELVYWNEQTIESGSYIIDQRQAMIGELEKSVRTIHGDLTDSAELLTMYYLSSFFDKQPVLGIEEIKTLFRENMAKNEKKDILTGLTSVGPHRDDLKFVVNGKNAALYGSRGQQRTVILSLKLAEAEVIQSRVNDSPVLLLDDVLSELDNQRRSQVLQFVIPFNQVLITTTDIAYFEPDLLSRTCRLRVKNGSVEGF